MRHKPLTDDLKLELIIELRQVSDFLVDLRDQFFVHLDRLRNGDAREWRNKMLFGVDSLNLGSASTLLELSAKTIEDSIEDGWVPPNFPNKVKTCPLPGVRHIKFYKKGKEGKWKPKSKSEEQAIANLVTKALHDLYQQHRPGWIDGYKFDELEMEGNWYGGDAEDQD